MMGFLRTQKFNKIIGYLKTYFSLNGTNDRAEKSKGCSFWLDDINNSSNIFHIQCGYLMKYLDKPYLWLFYYNMSIKLMVDE